jgi:hypothetical protein
MAVRSGMADTCPAGDCPEGEMSRPIFLKQGKSGIYERFFQVAVVIWFSSFPHGEKYVNILTLSRLGTILKSSLHCKDRVKEAL